MRAIIVSLPVVIFFILQVLSERLFDEMTFFAVVMYAQAVIFSKAMTYRKGMLYELLVFIAAFSVIIFSAYCLRPFDAIGFAAYSALLLLINAKVVVDAGKISTGEERIIINKFEDLNKVRLLTACFLSAPFFLILTFSVPAYYSGNKDASILIYFSTFMYGISYVVGKRIAGIYKVGNPNKGAPNTERS